MMADNHYGWFENVERGVYGMSGNGEVAVGEYGVEPNSNAT